MLRDAAYAVARFLGDYNAVRKGRIGRRLANKLIGRHIVSKVWFR